MYKVNLGFQRYQLLMMDLVFLLQLAGQIQVLAIMRRDKEKVSAKKDTQKFTKRMGLEDDFVELLIEMFTEVDLDRSFFFFLQKHSKKRNSFILTNIAPLKSENDLKIQDGEWETERKKKVRSVCEGSGIPSQAITLILNWLHSESREVIKNALARK